MTLKRKKGRWRLWIRPLLWMPLIAAVAVSLPRTAWRTLGEQAVLCAASLQNPASQLAAPTATVSTVAKTVPTFPSDPSGYRQAEEAAVIPPKGNGGGAVMEEAIVGTPSVGAVAVKNTSGVTYDLEGLLNRPLPTATDAQAQVLIVHTHAGESYMPYYAGYYNAEDTVRSDDPSETVVAVGKAITDELRACGIGVIHDTTRHDVTYTGAYARSAETVQRQLEAHPSIRLVLDIHRDAIMYEDGTKVKPTATVEDRKAAQVMLIVGGTHSQDYPNPHCETNLQWGLQLHNALESSYEGLMRPLYLMDARYNQELFAGSLLLEVGTDANTLSEALYSGRLIGKQLAQLLQTADS